MTIEIKSSGGRTKRCPRCGETKSWAAYGKNRKTVTGLQVYCRACRNSEPRAREQRRACALRAYGLTPEAFDKLLSDQDGRCAICRTTEPGAKGWRIDTAPDCCPSRTSCGVCIRGLLCARCGLGLGFFGADYDRLWQAIRYLGPWVR